MKQVKAAYLLAVLVIVAAVVVHVKYLMPKDQPPESPPVAAPGSPAASTPASPVASTPASPVAATPGSPVAGTPWLPAVAALGLLFPIRRHIRRQSVKMTIAGDKLRYEAGLLSKTTRNIQLSKVQDVRVDQSLGQRMLGVGDISIETSGETSRLEMDNVDAPQAIADEIVAASQHHGSTQAGGGNP
jgi:membrane protein YdbS with pleckstrin-like domain